MIRPTLRMSLRCCFAAALFFSGCSGDDDAGGSPPAAEDAGSATDTTVPAARRDGAPDTAPRGTPEVSAACADLAQGWNRGFEAGGIKRDFILTLPDGVDNGGPLPVVFNWHGLGDSAANMSHLLSGLVNGPRLKFIAVTPEDSNFVLEIPYAGGQVMDWDIWRVDPDSNREIALFDEVLACIDQKWGVDHDRVHSIGFSIGGVVTDLIASFRDDTIASVATYSGGYWNNAANIDVVLNVVVQWPAFAATSRYAQLFLHGGADDVFNAGVTQLHFDQYAKNDVAMLNSRGHDAVLCGHGIGHMAPAPGMPGSRVIQFLADHPRGTVDSPYAESGLPESFADYCKFMPGTGSPRLFR